MDPASERRASFSQRGAGARRLLASTVLGALATVRIRTLGSFGVVRNGVRLESREWQSKKARDLVKVLVARRGKPVPREMLVDALWPEVAGDLANRLSVALTTTRSVFDPQRRFPQDHFIVADRETVALSLEHVDVDVERFLDLVDRGDRLEAIGRTCEATELWTRAVDQYGGDFLEDDNWQAAVPLREQARAVFVSTARRLADIAVDRHDWDAATRYLVGILDRDDYDEDAHVSLIACFRRGGRSGHADQQYQTYSKRMHELRLTAVASDALMSQSAAS